MVILALKLIKSYYVNRYEHSVHQDGYDGGLSCPKMNEKYYAALAPTEYSLAYVVDWQISSVSALSGSGWHF